MISALIIRNDSALTASPSESARQLISNALDKGALIGQVESPDDNEKAALAQKEMKAILSDFEKARKEAKAPVLDYGRKIDNILRREIEEVENEYARIGQLVAQFLLAERRRVAAQMQLEQDRMSKLEAEKMAALAQEKSPAKQEAIMEHFSLKAAAEAPVIAPQRVSGQRLVEQWQITLTNPIELAKWALVSGNWGCIKITPMMTELKAVLDIGATVPGIKAEKIAVAGMSSSRQPSAIGV